MTGPRLYLLLLASVLAFGACGRENAANDPGAAASGSRQLSEQLSEQTSEQPAASTAPAASAIAPNPEERPAILFFGDSITAGLGVDAVDAFPARIAARLDSLGLDYEVVNAGLSGETSAGGLRRIDWVLRRPIDVFVLELGGNDGLRGIDLSTTEENLRGIIRKTQQANPDVKLVIAGMLVPPNLGRDYTAAFSAMYPALSGEFDAVLIPFLMDGVAGVPGRMQGDGIHPTAPGHAVMADLVWRYLQPLL